jgi:protein arginine kinase
MPSAIFQNVVCAECGEREAMIFIRRSGGKGGGRDLFLCEECAKGRGIIAGKGSLDLKIDDLLGADLDSASPRDDAVACPGCGLELSELMRRGRLGCAGCADAFAKEIAQAFGRRLGADGEIPTGAPPSPGLEAELQAALASEDYERAASLRDELSLAAASRPAVERSPALSRAARPAPAYPDDFPLRHDSFSYTKARDDDVVLMSSARVYRDIAGLPFPGTPQGSPAPSRAIVLERLLSYGGWSSRAMAELGPSARRSLSERGILSRGYAADDDAPLATAAEAGCYALLDEGDHLRLRTVRPGLDLDGALASSLAQAERLGRDLPFASRPDIGWICSRLADCGLGSSLTVTVHLPALEVAGLRDRLFRALMAEGAVLSGFYSTGEESSGSVYEIGVEPAARLSQGGMVRTLSSAVAKVVQAERRARSETASRARPALIDAEGRAFGILRHCGLLGADEAASLVSTLRLASLRGALPGADARRLGALLLGLGPGSVAQAEGRSDLPEGEAADSLRARYVKAALGDADYSDRAEEGA